MTEEEKYINKLFQAAKNEVPKRSFEEVATHFKENLVTTPATTSWAKSYFKYFSLNSIIMTIITSLAIAGFLWLSPSKIEQKAPPTEIEATPIIGQKIKEQEKRIATPQPINNTLVKKDIQPNKLEIPTEKRTTKVNLAGKEVQKKKVSSIEQPKKIDQSIAKTSSVKEKIITAPTPPPSPKEKAPTATSTTTLVTATPDNAVPIPAKTKSPNQQSQLLSLEHTANEKTTTRFLVGIRAHGFNLTKKVNRNSGKIERINLHISLYNGLDWKIKLRNFEVFELKILLDEYKNPTGLAYRLDKTSKFSEVIALNSRARSNHKFSKNGSNGSHSFIKSTKQKN